MSTSIPSSINKNVKVDLAIVGDCAHVLEDMMRMWRAEARQPDKQALAPWWKQIDKWRGRKCLRYRASNDVIKPQYAIERLYALTKDRDVYITTEVGQHQMWAAQFYPVRGAEPLDDVAAGSAPWATACRRRSACRSRIRTRW